jgi:hypothetical protein
MSTDGIVLNGLGKSLEIEVVTHHLLEVAREQNKEAIGADRNYDRRDASMEVLSCCPINRRGLLVGPAWRLRNVADENTYTRVIQMILWQQRSPIGHEEAVGIRSPSSLRLHVRAAGLPKSNSADKGMLKDRVDTLRHVTQYQRMREGRMLGGRTMRPV